MEIKSNLPFSKDSILKRGAFIITKVDYSQREIKRVIFLWFSLDIPRDSYGFLKFFQVFSPIDCSDKLFERRFKGVPILVLNGSL